MKPHQKQLTKFRAQMVANLGYKAAKKGKCRGVSSQKAATPPAVQQPPPSKWVLQPVQNVKETEKTPEPVVVSLQSFPVPPSSQNQESIPTSKETTPQPAISPSPSEDPKSDRSSKEREINSNSVKIEATMHDDDDNKDDKPSLKYTYKDDQWSPVNPDGRKCYDLRFLLELQYDPLSLKKPESLPDIEIVRNGPRRYKKHKLRGPTQHIEGGPDFTPAYMKGVKSNKQPRVVGHNNSQQCHGELASGQVSRGDIDHREQRKVIVIPVSTGKEPKLKTTENTWKPFIMDNNSASDDQAATKEESQFILNMEPLRNEISDVEKLFLPSSTEGHAKPTVHMKLRNSGPSATVETLTAIASKRSMVHQEDAYDIFGKNVAANLKRVPEGMQPYAQKLINDVIFLGQTGGLTVNTKISN